jgi:hypothetical protein
LQLYVLPQFICSIRICHDSESVDLLAQLSCVWGHVARIKARYVHAIL